MATCNFTNRRGKVLFYFLRDPFHVHLPNRLRLLKFVSTKLPEFNRNRTNRTSCESCNFQPKHVFIGWITLWKLNESEGTGKNRRHRVNSYEHNEIVSFRRLIRRPPAPKISIQLIIHFVCPRITYITRDCTYLSTLASRRSPLPRLLVASGYSSSNWIVSLTENHPTFSLCRVVSPRSLSWVWLSQWGCSEHKSPPPSSPPSPFPGIYFAGGSCLQLFSGATLKLNPTARFRIHVRVCVHIVHILVFLVACNKIFGAKERMGRKNHPRRFRSMDYQKSWRL